jgi:tight adherence protein C
MFTIVKLLFAISIVALAFLVLYGLLQRRVRGATTMQQRINEIRNIDRVRGDDEVKKRVKTTEEIRRTPFEERVLAPALNALGKGAASFTPREMELSMRRKLIHAGLQNKYTAVQYLGICMFGAIFMFALTFLYVITAFDMEGIRRVMLLLFGTAFGAFAPVFVLMVLTSQRQEQIRHQLPEVLDLLCVSVQAGLSFDGALTKITQRMQGPLIDEFRRMQDDQRMGVVRRTALQAFSSRCDVQDVSLFVTALLQAERLGSSMGHTLKTQADNMRERHRQLVKTKAMKTPIKIIFPLVFFIFPCIFIVCLGPAIISLMTNMK